MQPIGRVETGFHPFTLDLASVRYAEVSEALWVQALRTGQIEVVDTERRFAVILDRDALRWFKPASGQFQIHYRDGAEQARYVPDFVAEAAAELLLLETKARAQMESREVMAKKAAAEEWCRRASAHAATYGGKPWRYVLVPHDVVTSNMTLEFPARA